MQRQCKVDSLAGVMAVDTSRESDLADKDQGSSRVYAVKRHGGGFGKNDDNLPLYIAYPTNDA